MKNYQLILNLREQLKEFIDKIYLKLRIQSFADKYFLCIYQFLIMPVADIR